MPLQEQGSTTKARGSILPDDKWHYVGETGEPAFEDSWVNYDAIIRASFIKDASGVVHLMGTVKSGSVGGSYAVFTLPAGYRPPINQGYAVSSNDAFGRLAVYTTGEVRVLVGSNIYVDIAISYYVG